MTSTDKTTGRQCWGRIKLFRRCRRIVPTGFFCSDHKMQPYAYLSRRFGSSVALMAGIITIVLFLQCPSEEELKLEKEVYSKVNGACHKWKNAYISLVPGRFSQYGEEYGDVWDMLLKVEPPRYSKEAWRRYYPLFDESALYVTDELDRLLASHSDVIPFDLRELMEVTKIAIENEQFVYKLIPSSQRPVDNKNVFFQVRFQSMIRALAKLSREADRLKHEID